LVSGLGRRDLVVFHMTPCLITYKYITFSLIIEGKCEFLLKL
jgi:hypothetical protein